MTEVASGHISIGRVKATHPVQNFEAKLGAEYLPLGYAMIELRDNPSEEAKHLYAVATCGVKVSF